MAIGYVTGRCYTMSNGIKKYEGNATQPSIEGNQSIPFTHYSLVNTVSNPEYYQYSIDYDANKFDFNGPPYNIATSTYYVSVSFPKFPKVYWNFKEKNSSDNTPHTIGIGMSAPFVSNRLDAPRAGKYEIPSISINNQSIGAIIAQGRNTQSRNIAHMTIKNNESITSITIVPPIFYYNSNGLRIPYYPRFSTIENGTIALYYSDGSAHSTWFHHPIPYYYHTSNGTAYLTDIMFAD